MTRSSVPLRVMARFVARPDRACFFDASRSGQLSPRAEHPIVRTHPYSGKKCLFVNEGYTASVTGMSTQESDALLSRLFEHCTRPEFVYRHRWRVGDFLIWDNCSTQHRAVMDYALPQRRLMERATLQGSAPF